MNVQELENSRKKIVKKRAIMILILFLIFLTIFGICFYFTNGVGLQFVLIFDFILCLVIGIVLHAILLGKDIKVFTSSFKRHFVLESLKKVFDNLLFMPESGLSKSKIDSLGVINTGDRFVSNDYIKGTYKGINVEQSDIHIEEKEETVDSEGHRQTYWVTLFRGRWMIFDFNKNFKANIILKSKKFSNVDFSLRLYNKLQMDDEMFNKLFKTYTVSDEEAFYILTPKIMDKLKNIATSNGNPLLICFINNKLHVAIDNMKDSFEPNINKTIVEEELIEEIGRDIKLITDFVDELNLDNNLFKGDVNNGR